MKFNLLLPDLCVSPSVLSELFQVHHARYMEAVPGWTLQSTRRKIAAFYWLKIVSKHFVLILSLAAILTLSIDRYAAVIFLGSLVPFSALVFFILFVSMYWPVYQLEFLPHLDTCIANFAGAQLDGIHAAKKRQYSVVSLMLIQCVTMELADLKTPLINTATAELFARQYGVSPKSVGPALQLILRADWNRKSIRKQTEITDDFETARCYFVALSDQRAIELLEKMQLKVLR